MNIVKLYSLVLCYFIYCGYTKTGKVKPAPAVSSRRTRRRCQMARKKWLLRRLTTEVCRERVARSSRPRRLPSACSRAGAASREGCFVGKRRHIPADAPESAFRGGRPDRTQPAGFRALPVRGAAARGSSLRDGQKSGLGFETQP